MRNSRSNLIQINKKLHGSVEAVDGERAPLAEEILDQGDDNVGGHAEIFLLDVVKSVFATVDEKTEDEKRIYVSNNVDFDATLDRFVLPIVSMTTQVELIFHETKCYRFLNISKTVPSYTAAQQCGA